MTLEEALAALERVRALADEADAKKASTGWSGSAVVTSVGSSRSISITVCADPGRIACT